MTDQILITGCGTFIPPEVIDNETLVKAYNAHVEEYNQEYSAEIASGDRTALKTSNADFIKNASGIEERHVMEASGIIDPQRLRPNLEDRNPDELSYQGEMGFAAAKNALDQANKSANDVGLLISACSNYERPYPSLAIEVQKALGIDGFAFDMNVACSSVPFAIRLAYNSLITQSELPGVLIVSPEFYTGHLNFRDRDSHFIFGDAAGALYLERSETSKSSNAFSVKNIHLQTHFSNNIRNDGGFLRQAVNRTDPWHPRNLFSQQGRAVFKEIVPLVSEMILNQLDEERIKSSSIKRVWLHQANSKMNLLLAKKVLDREPSSAELPLILKKYGNTGAAGVVLAFSESQNLDKGSWGVFCAFGAGYSAGSVLLQKC